MDEIIQIRINLTLKYIVVVRNHDAVDIYFYNFIGTYSHGRIISLVFYT